MIETGPNNMGMREGCKEVGEETDSLEEMGEVGEDVEVIKFGMVDLFTFFLIHPEMFAKDIFLFDDHFDETYGVH